MSLFERYTNSKLYVFFDILYTIILVNMLWLAVSMSGLIIFTFMPATVAVYLIMLNINQEGELKPFKAFFRIFKKEYIKSQKVFLLMALIGFVVITNTVFYYTNLETLTLIHGIGLFTMALILIAYTSACIHVIPVYIYFPELGVVKTVKNAFFLGFAYPFRTFLALVSSVLVILITTIIQTLLPFFLISIIALITLFIIKNKYDILRKDSETLRLKDYLED